MILLLLGNPSLYAEIDLVLPLHGQLSGFEFKLNDVPTLDKRLAKNVYTT